MQDRVDGTALIVLDEEGSDARLLRGLILRVLVRELSEPDDHESWTDRLRERFHERRSDSD